MKMFFEKKNKKKIEGRERNRNVSFFFFFHFQSDELCEGNGNKRKET